MVILFLPSTRANGLLLVWLFSLEARTALQRENVKNKKFQKEV